MNHNKSYYLNVICLVYEEDFVIIDRKLRGVGKKKKTMGWGKGRKEEMFEMVRIYHFS